MFPHTIALHWAQTGTVLENRCDTAPCSQTRVPFKKSDLPALNTFPFGQYTKKKKKTHASIIYACIIISNY